MARSPDLTAAVLLIGAMLLLNWYGGGVVNALRALVANMLGPRKLSEMGGAAAGIRTLADAERAHILATLRATKWVIGGIYIALLALILTVWRLSVQKWLEG